MLMVYKVRTEVEEGEGIRVVDSIKYLVLEVG